MATGLPILGRLEALVSRYRDDIARLTPEVAHLRAEREIVMQYLSELGSSLGKLIEARQASDDKAAAEGKRADVAEAKNATLEAQIASDEATLKAMLDAADAEVSKETAPALAKLSPDAIVTTAPSGAVVTIDPTVGTTTHVAADVTTTVPHDGSAPTAVDTSVIPAQPVEPAPAAVAEAVQASAAVGVTVPVQG